MAGEGGGGMFPPSTTSNIHIVYAKISLRPVRTGFGRSFCSPRDEWTVDRTDPVTGRTETESPVPSVLVRFGPGLFLVLRTGPLSTSLGPGPVVN
jgi:hypothetical protein